MIFVLLFFPYENVFFYLTFVFSKRFTFLINKIVNYSITDANLVRASVFSNNGNGTLFPLNWILRLLQIRSISGKLQKAEEARFRDWTGRKGGRERISKPGKVHQQCKKYRISYTQCKKIFN